MFLRKFMALMRLGYDNWEPALEETKWGIPQKSFTRFRKDITVMAGYYELTVDINGEPKVEAKSIAFESMDEHEFSEVHEAALGVISNLLGTAPVEIQRMVIEFY